MNAAALGRRTSRQCCPLLSFVVSTSRMNRITILPTSGEIILSSWDCGERLISFETSARLENTVFSYSWRDWNLLIRLIRDKRFLKIWRAAASCHKIVIGSIDSIIVYGSFDASRARNSTIRFPMPEHIMIGGKKQMLLIFWQPTFLLDRWCLFVGSSFNYDWVATSCTSLMEWVL